MTPPDSSKWRAFYAAALGSLFDGYESYVLVLVAVGAVRAVTIRLAHRPLDANGVPGYDALPSEAGFAGSCGEVCVCCGDGSWG